MLLARFFPSATDVTEHWKTIASIYLSWPTGFSRRQLKSHDWPQSSRLFLIIRQFGQTIKDCIRFHFHHVDGSTEDQTIGKAEEESRLSKICISSSRRARVLQRKSSTLPNDLKLTET
ncbi:hypothetical protein RR46_02194 [Papilio xuthus]|uniref:Uncharacterized protein n=1 Tax=Papilio xuthus TaxID=66420 RepID=A0A194QJ43_PAPXU|nr:hypothetical protein RR46_02194 [Papilio xuthus]